MKRMGKMHDTKETLDWLCKTGLKAGGSAVHDPLYFRKCSGGGSISALFLEFFIVPSEDE